MAGFYVGFVAAHRRPTGTHAAHQGREPVSRITIIASIAEETPAVKRCGEHCKNNSLLAESCRAARVATRANTRAKRAGCQKPARRRRSCDPGHKPAKAIRPPRPPPEPASLSTMAAGDAGAFVLNIISSVFIISVNKRLMGSPPNFNFRYVVTLNALHYITTSIWTRVAKVIGLAKQEESSKAPAHVPLVFSVVLFTTVSNASIISLNTSLMLNSITLYQIAKLGIIPCTCCVEYLLYGRVFTSKMVLAIVVTLMGVGLVSINELNYSDSTLGVFVALCSVVSSSGQQLLVRHLQLKHNVSAGQLLGVVAPAQGASLLLLSPFPGQALDGGLRDRLRLDAGGHGVHGPVLLGGGFGERESVPRARPLHGRGVPGPGPREDGLRAGRRLRLRRRHHGPASALGMIMAIAGMMAYSRARPCKRPTWPAAQEKPGRRGRRHISRRTRRTAFAARSVRKFDYESELGLRAPRRPSSTQVEVAASTA